MKPRYTCLAFGMSYSNKMMHLCQSYVNVHPEVILIDPIESVMRLQNRRQQYDYVSQSDVVSNCEYISLMLTTVQILTDQIKSVDYIFVGQVFTDMMYIEQQYCSRLQTP